MDAFIEDCIKSVREQSYPYIQHLIIDCQSTDITRDIVERNRNANMTFICEPDSGQSEAINKGLRFARGEIFAWLNADDRLYDRNVIQDVVAYFKTSDNDVVFGDGVVIDDQGQQIGVYETLPYKKGLLSRQDYLLQPSTFMKTSLLRSLGGVKESYTWVMDWDLWLRTEKAGAKFSRIDRCLSCERLHGNTKTSTGGYLREQEIIKLMLNHRIPNATLFLHALRYLGLRLERALPKNKVVLSLGNFAKRILQRTTSLLRVQVRHFTEM